MGYDVIVIGAGLSGLSAASLLAKRGLRVAVIEQAFKPGGSCGIFKRNDAIFDTGAAMLFGFGEKGFNVHRFLFNVLEEPIDVIKHNSLYSMYYKGKKIEFHYDIDKYIKDLIKIFPREEDNLRRFHLDMIKLYDKVIAKKPVFSTPDQLNKTKSFFKMLKSPVSYIKYLSYMNISAKDLLNKYFSNPDILNFFNKLTSTYCYTNIEETPALLAVVMFICNHVGGSFYPAGSTLYISGILEKAIEENDGEILYNRRADEIIIEENQVKGIKLNNGKIINADYVIFSGTVWNLYNNLLDSELVPEEKKKWVSKLKATNPSVILYALVKKEVIPEETTPITLFTENEFKVDENEVTVYILSIEDKTICDERYHTVMAIGKTFRKWPAYSKNYYSSQLYKTMKSEEKDRLMSVMEERFPGFINATVYSEVSTPLTIERYTMKNNGSVARPMQSLGQHMLRRLHIKSEYKGLYCCGESTVMGTGTPAVTISGITAANAILKEKKLPRFKYSKRLKNYVREHKPPFLNDSERKAIDPKEALQLKAKNCLFCENPHCMDECQMDIRGINRRLTVGNFLGAYKIMYNARFTPRELKNASEHCKLNQVGNTVIDIPDIIDSLKGLYKGE